MEFYQTADAKARELYEWAIENVDKAHWKGDETGELVNRIITEWYYATDETVADEVGDFLWSEVDAGRD